MTLIRIFLFWIHFKSGRNRTFYRWLKRHCKCLAIIEGEDRLTLDLYKLPEYLTKIKADA